MVRDLTPLVGRQFSFGAVPDWDSEWPLGAHREYCDFVRESAAEVLLHGCVHRRQGGGGAVSWLAEGSDEMNGLDREGTLRALERGQDVFADVFGGPARGFIAPAWQRGRVDVALAGEVGIEYLLGFFSLESADRAVPLATWTWDCGRWGWLGHVGHGIGRVLQMLGRGVPVLAIHPRDLDRGYWPGILRLTRSLLDAGYEPVTAAALLAREDAQVGA